MSESHFAKGYPNSAIRVEIENSDAVKEAVAKASKGMQEIAYRMNGELGAMAKMEAQKLVPVRTGYLQSTIYYRRNSQYEVSVGASAPYAGFVEFGTRFMDAQPFMRKSIEYAMTQFEPVARKIVDDIMRGAGFK